jgi:hypothetical protein
MYPQIEIYKARMLNFYNWIVIFVMMLLLYSVLLYKIKLTKNYNISNIIVSNYSFYTTRIEEFSCIFYFQPFKNCTKY